MVFVNVDAETSAKAHLNHGTSLVLCRGPSDRHSNDAVGAIAGLFIEFRIESRVFIPG